MQLLLGEGKNPLKVEVEVPQPADKGYTERMTAAFAEPVSNDTVLIDKQARTLGAVRHSQTERLYIGLRLACLGLILPGLPSLLRQRGDHLGGRLSTGAQGHSRGRR
jgi:hypothetical protein